MLCVKILGDVLWIAGALVIAWALLPVLMR